MAFDFEELFAWKRFVSKPKPKSSIEVTVTTEKQILLEIAGRTYRLNAEAAKKTHEALGKAIEMIA